MKKILLLVGALFFAFLVAVISVPLFVDVDKYRPQILEAVNSKVNGKVDLGKLSLSLWGAVKVKAESIDVRVNGFDKPLLQAKEFQFEVPYLSLITGPEIIAAATNPKISIVRNANGLLNIQALMPQKTAQNQNANPDPSSQEEEPIKTTAAAPEKEEGGKIPGFLLKSSLGIAIDKGDVEILDRQAGAAYQLAGLELNGRNLGFNRTMTISFLAPMKGQQANLKFQGDVSGNAKLHPIMVDRALRSAKGQISLDASKLAIDYGKNLFQKSTSMPLKIDADFDGTEKEMVIKKLDANLNDLVLTGKGAVALHPALRAKIDLNSNSWSLAKLSEVLPMLRTYNLKGTAQLNAGVNVEGNKNTANGDLKVTDGEFFPKDMLKEPLKIQAQVGFSENSLSLSRLTLTGPESDLQVQGKVTNFAAPKFSLTANGKSFNLDKVMVAAPEEKSAALKAFALIQTAHAAPPAKDVNPMASAFASPMMSQANGTLNAKIGRVVAKGAEIKNVEVEAQLLPGAMLQVKRGALQGFGGAAVTSAALSLKSPRLDFKSNGKANGVSAKEAIKAYFPKFQNTLEGKANADWNLSGSLYPAAARLESLAGTVKINAADGILRTADFKDSIQGVIAKVPFLKNKTVPDVEEGFKTLRADMAFQGGNIKVEPFELIGKGPKAIDVRGKSHITASLQQESYLDVYDPNGILPKEISQPGKVALPLKITGPLTSPKTDYGYTVSRLGKTAGKDAAKKAISKGLEKYLGGGEAGDDKKKKITDQLKKRFKF